MSDAQARAVIATLADARRQLVDDLARLEANGTFPAYYRSQMIAAIDRAVRDWRANAGAAVNKALSDAFGQALRDRGDALTVGGIETPQLAGISRDQIFFSQQTAADLIQRVGQDFRVGAQREITATVSGRQSSGQALKNIQALLKTEPTRQASALGPIANQAERVLRTELMGVYSLASDMADERTAELVPGIRKTWLSARDPRTRPAHIAADRRYRPGGSVGPIPFHDDYQVGGEKAAFPHDPRLSAGNRINCRCISILWSLGWGS